jgi:hypothetical protein
MSKLEVMKQVREILANRCEDPSDAMIKQGEALVAIGKVLKGMSLAEARATMKAVEQLESVTRPPNAEIRHGGENL